MIGSLLYVTTTRPDVMNVVYQVARFQSSPKDSHLLAVKRILRYLKGTIDYGLWYPKGNNLDLYDFKLVGTPMVTGCKLRNIDDSKNVEKKIYRSMMVVFYM